MTNSKNGFSYQPLKKSATRSWRDLPVPPDGANESPVEAFAHVAAFILANQETFTINDFVNLLKSRDIEDFQEIKKLYGRWTKQMQLSGRIQAVPACYDDCLWRVST